MAAAEPAPCAGMGPEAPGPPVEELAAGELPAVLRGVVRAFLEARRLGEEDLAAAAPAELTEAFGAAPGALGLGHRAALRRLGAAARRRSEERAAAAGLGAWRATLHRGADCVARGRLLPGWIPVLQAATLIYAGLLSAGWGLWAPLTEWNNRCSHPALPANQSGVKVLLAGLAKTGTTTMSASLHELGLEHSYHSEDIGMFVWGGLYDDFWMRRENGGVRDRLHMMHTVFPAFFSAPGVFPLDAEVLLNIAPGELAAALSRCRVDAMAFDAAENLFWPVYHVSPGAKVISLGWRSYDEYIRSTVAFAPMHRAMLYVLGLLTSAQHLLPWGALLHVLDPLLGRPMARLLARGGPPLAFSSSSLQQILLNAVGMRRVEAHKFHGLSWTPGNVGEYQGFFRKVRETVPQSQLLEWDMRRHTWRDLCDFIGVGSCNRTGLLPRAMNLFFSERQHPASSLARVPLYLALHWANLRILWALFFLLLGLAGEARRLLLRAALLLSQAPLGQLARAASAARAGLVAVARALLALGLAAALAAATAAGTRALVSRLL